MATITDLYGNKITEVDLGSILTEQEDNDSNINVYEFGNLILADILPHIIWLVNSISDLYGDSVSATDLSEASVSATDIQEATVSVSDKSGSTVSDTDWTETVLVVTDFLSSVNSILDTTEATVTISDWSGNQNTTTDTTNSNSEKYDFAEYTYETTRINYDGYPIQGVVVDMSGS